MAITLPSSPTLGEIYTAPNGSQWICTAVAPPSNRWAPVSSAGSVTASAAVVDLPGGTLGAQTGIGAAWTALDPKPGASIIYANFAGVTYIRTGAGGSDGHWVPVGSAHIAAATYEVPGGDYMTRDGSGSLSGRGAANFPTQADSVLVFDGADGIPDVKTRTEFINWQGPGLTVDRQTNVNGNLSITHEWSQIAHVLVLDGDATIETLVNVPDLFFMRVYAKQDATGGHELTFNASFKAFNNMVLDNETAANAATEYEIFRIEAGDPIYVKRGGDMLP